MKVSVDPDSDILYVKLYDLPVDITETVEPGVVVDYDVDGAIVGVEIRDVSWRLRRPPPAPRSNQRRLLRGGLVSRDGLLQQLGDVEGLHAALGGDGFHALVEHLEAERARGHQ